jgi:hypothetical protein
LSSLSHLTLRRQSSVSATSFAKLASGDDLCEFCHWLRTNYWYERLLSDFDWDAWVANHTLMVHKAAAELKKEGYTVFLESQNAFNVTGKTGAKFSGRADIVAVQGDTALVVDCKTGQYRAFHALQVRLYMYMLEHHQPNHPAHGCKSFLGRVLYQSGTVNKLPPLPTDVALKLLKHYMAVLLQETPPAPTPSYSECRFCDIGKELCPERIDTEPPASTTDLF